MCQCFLADSEIRWGRWFGPKFVDHWENEDQLWDFKGFCLKILQKTRSDPACLPRDGCPCMMVLDELNLWPSEYISAPWCFCGESKWVGQFRRSLPKWWMIFPGNFVNQPKIQGICTSIFSRPKKTKPPRPDWSPSHEARGEVTDDTGELYVAYGCASNLRQRSRAMWLSVAISLLMSCLGCLKMKKYGYPAWWTYK